MSKAGALDLATSIGGEIDKNEVLFNVEKYVLSLSFASFGLFKVVYDWRTNTEIHIV